MLEDKERTELIGLVVWQYVRLAGPIDQMFQVISPRVTYTASLWRQEGFYKGSGSCRDIDKHTSEIGLKGIAKDTLVLLREERSQQVPGVSLVSDCPYHRCERGCILHELKSPHCLSHMEAAWELRKFGIDGYRLSENINRWLSQILSSQSFAEGFANELFVEEKVSYISCLMGEIEKFPISYIGLPARP